MRNGWRTAVPVGKAVGAMSELTYLFDTNALIDIYRGRQRIKPTFDQLIAGDIRGCISVITEAELWRGLRPGELDTHNALIEQFTVLPLNSDVARLAGSWMAQFDNVGLGWMDAFIAASAKLTNMPLLTRDNRLASLLEKELTFVVYD
ncbi:MAG: PIN domain-containing protein [Anaerolineales bacterium]|nr:PIN domain-containing protein [Anaerolineales bacterium]